MMPRWLRNWLRGLGQDPPSLCFWTGSFLRIKLFKQTEIDRMWSLPMLLHGRSSSTYGSLRLLDPHLSHWPWPCGGSWEPIKISPWCQYPAMPINSLSCLRHTQTNKALIISRQSVGQSALDALDWESEPDNKISARPDLATYLLQILIPSPIEKIAYCQKVQFTLIYTAWTQCLSQDLETGCLKLAALCKIFGRPNF